MISGKRKQKLILYGIFMLLMLVCAGFTSPLYPHYTGQDSSIFLVIARGIINGKVPYRDLFDHKGPVFYWMEALGCFFGDRTGVFVIQCLLLGLDLAMIDRISALFDGDFPAAAFSFASVFFILFQHGNLTEEFSTPFVFLALFHELRFLKSEEKKHPPENGFLYGLILGILAFIRLNNAVVVCALLLCIAITLAADKQWGNLLANAGLGILGLAAVTLPVCLYYYSQGALYDMLYGTFLKNFLYARDNAHISVFQAPLFYFCLFLPGICSFAVFLRKWKEERNRVYLSLMTAVVLTWGMLSYTNSYVHYFMLGIPLFTTAAAVSGQDIRALYTYLKETLFPKEGKKERDADKAGRAPGLRKGCAVFLLIVTVLYAGNAACMACAPIYKTYLTDIARDEYEKVQTAVSVIPPEERDSCIAYNVIANFYYHSDIIPCCRFFALQKWMSTDLVDADREFMDFLKREHPLWVVLNFYGKDKEVVDILSENYSVVYYDELYLICRYTGPGA